MASLWGADMLLSKCACSTASPFTLTLKCHVLGLQPPRLLIAADSEGEQVQSRVCSEADAEGVLDGFCPTWAIMEREPDYPIAPERPSGPP
jgi:hypothetical protein